MCPHHWRSLPKPMRDDINRAWQARKATLQEYVENREDQPPEERRRLRSLYDFAASEHERVKAEVIASLTQPYWKP